jgi:hypothetical protein
MPLVQVNWHRYWLEAEGTFQVSARLIGWCGRWKLASGPENFQEIDKSRNQINETRQPGTYRESLLKDRQDQN